LTKDATAAAGGAIRRGKKRAHESHFALSSAWSVACAFRCDVQAGVRDTLATGAGGGGGG